MHAPRAVVLAAALLSLGPALAGCSSTQEKYCGALKDHQTVFSDDGTGVQLLSQLDVLRDLAKKAPDDLRDEWQTVVTALSGLQIAIEESGVAPGDFVAGKPPASVDEKTRETIAAAASQVAQPDVVDAFGGIDQHAKDVCKLQLGL